MIRFRTSPAKNMTGSQEPFPNARKVTIVKLAANR